MIGKISFWIDKAKEVNHGAISQEILVVEEQTDMEVELISDSDIPSKNKNDTADNSLGPGNATVQSQGKTQQEAMEWQRKRQSETAESSWKRQQETVESSFKRVKTPDLERPPSPTSPTYYSFDQPTTPQVGTESDRTSPSSMDVLCNIATAALMRKSPHLLSVKQRTLALLKTPGTRHHDAILELLSPLEKGSERTWLVLLLIREAKRFRKHSLAQQLQDFLST